MQVMFEIIRVDFHESPQVLDFLSVSSLGTSCWHKMHKQNVIWCNVCQRQKLKKL